MTTSITNVDACMIKQKSFLILIDPRSWARQRDYTSVD